jgi:hypothetical protein
MTTYSIPSTSISIDSLLKVLEATSEIRSPKIDDYSNYAGLGQSTTRRAFSVLEAIGLVINNESDEYICTNDSVSRANKNEINLSILKKAFLSFKPFELFSLGLAMGETPTESYRKTAVLLNLSADDDDRESIIDLGIKLGLLEWNEEGLSLTVREELKIEETKHIVSSEDVESEVKARLYLAMRVGREAFNFLDESEKELLTNGLITFYSDPQQAVEDSGQAIENFLREIASDQGYSNDAQKCNGISQLVNLLYSKSIVHVHHLHLGQGCSTLRNAVAHNKDKKTMKPWEFTETGAFLQINLSLTLISSIFLYIYKGRQTF